MDIIRLALAGLLLAGPALTLGAAAPAGSARDRPNVVFILADDFGYGSANVYGADRRLVRTPHIDRIAAEGMLFTDVSAPASICSPTRYGFVTGRYPWRSRQKYGVLYWWDNLLPDSEGDSIADLMKRHGYATAHIGKWHLGYGRTYPVDYTGPLTPGPNEIGFDYHLGVPHQHGYIMGVYVENDRVRGLRSRTLSPYSRSFYQAEPFIGIDAPQRIDKQVTAELAEFAVDWIRRQRGTPFFLYFAPVAVHHPITPSDAMRGTSGAGAYGDFIHDLDRSVGLLLETLDYLNLAHNTLLIFTSDNGGEIPGADNRSPEAQARLAGLQSNGKLRGDKHTIWEGGTRVPFVARWPGRIRAGSRCGAMINLVDMYATLSELVAGRRPPPGTAADSHSFLSCLLGAAGKPPRDSMVTQDARGLLAIRRDGWKYIDNTPPIPLESFPAKHLAVRKQVAAAKAELYHLAEDPAEQHDLYASRPDVVARLRAELTRLKAGASRN